MRSDPRKRKLIEVALPLDAINRESSREKGIRQGHPSTLHLWWARRPLAACRAVLFAQLVDDPSSSPDLFPTEEAQTAERLRLFEILERLVKWENTLDPAVLDAARREIRRCTTGELPPVLDPFAGGGSIPLEAQRLGLEAYAGDLNPVAVLINKSLIEIPARWSGHPPIHKNEGRLATSSWERAQGLADDVRYYGGWLRDRAFERIGHLYPDARLDTGARAPVIAWIWARSVRCPNPACGATMPLVSSWWYGKKKGKEAWCRPVVEGKKVRYEVGTGSDGPPEPTKIGRGSRFRCLVCGEVSAEGYVKEESLAGRLGSEMIGVVADGDRKRIYLPPSEEHIAAAKVKRPDDVPDGDMPKNPRWFSPPAFGMESFSDLFTNRQLVALTTFTDLVSEAWTLIEADGIASGLSRTDASEYANAVVTYLGMIVSRVSDYASTTTTWASNPQMEILRNTFARQAIAMTWDYAEGNVFGPSSGTIDIMVNAAAKVIERLPCGVGGTVSQQVAEDSIASLDGVVITTDPPYYDNIGYSDLSDFFYLWLRRSLRPIYPALFGTLLTPKAEELIASPYRFDGSREQARDFFEKGFVQTFTQAKIRQDPNYPMAIFYAFKQSEGEGDGGVASTGWETMLEGLVQAGLTVVATWPIRTEKAGRTIGIGTNALASSIVLACRVREAEAGVTDRRSFLSDLRAELPDALRRLQQGSVAPVDLAQAAIGPGMAVFTRYAKVIEPSGDPMRVRTALGLINQVLDEVLAEQEGDFDSDTRWALKWFEQHGFDQGSFDAAEILFKATGTALNGLKASGIIASEKGKVWLVQREDLPKGWDPAVDDRVPVWEATQHLVRELDRGGEVAAADLLARLGGLGETARELAYRLYSICERKGWAKEAGAYNALAVSWLDIQRLASADAPAANEQGSLL